MESESPQTNGLNELKMDPSKKTGSGERAVFKGLIRPYLDHYCPASNLALNEIVRLRIKQGEKIYHFAFGQSPFPVMPCMIKALQEHAGEMAYLPVAGKYFPSFSRRII